MSLMIRRGIFKPGSWQELESTKSLAITMGSQGHQEEACDIQREVLEGIEKVH